MKVGVLNISESGQFVMSVPQGTELQSAAVVGGQIQVFYTCKDDTGPKDNVDLRVVNGAETYDDDYKYLDAIVVANGNVRHVVHRAAKAGPPPQVNPLEKK